MPICMTAHYQIPKDRLEECRKTVTEFIRYIRANEPGILFYTALQEITDETRFLHLMVFEDQRAVTRHQSSPATRRFVETIYPAAVNPLEFKEHGILGFKAAADLGEGV
ncbi:MAG: putative quinol monooxygenase [Nitrospinaceae bacterium]